MGDFMLKSKILRCGEEQDEINKNKQINKFNLGSLRTNLLNERNFRIGNLLQQHLLQCVC